MFNICKKHDNIFDIIDPKTGSILHGRSREITLTVPLSENIRFSLLFIKYIFCMFRSNWRLFFLL